MKPLILDYSESRKGEIVISYHYNFQESINMILINGISTPFIDSDAGDISLITKTKVKSETDDDGYSILELETKSFSKQESDDESVSMLELQTKTLVKQERDDENYSNI